MEDGVAGPIRQDSPMATAELVLKHVAQELKVEPALIRCPAAVELTVPLVLAANPAIRNPVLTMQP